MEPYADADQAACLTTCTRPTSCTSGLLQVRQMSRVNLSHPDRVLYPDDGITKGDLFRYYERVASVLVPPSPKFQEKLAIEPSGSAEPVLLKATAAPAVPVYGPLMVAVGV